MNSQKIFEDKIFVVSNPVKFRDELQDLMKLTAGIIRDETKLKAGLNRVLQLNEEFYSKDNITKEFNINYEDSDYYADAENIVLTYQVKSSLVVCEAIIKSALMRQESRGAHYRSDFPKIDEEKWACNIYCSRKFDEEMVLFKHNVKEMKGELADFLSTHVNVKAEHHREFE